MNAVMAGRPDTDRWRWVDKETAKLKIEAIDRNIRKIPSHLGMRPIWENAKDQQVYKRRCGRVSGAAQTGLVASDRVSTRVTIAGMR